MRIQPFTRVVSAVVVALALAVLVAAPAEARPSSLPRLKLDVSWLGSTLTWLSTFFSREDTNAQRPAEPKGRPSPPDDDDGGITVTPNTGGCIDPSGNPCVPPPGGG
jgi:hypothetical protein